MANKLNKEKLIWIFELATVTALQILILLSVVVATIILYVLFAQDIYSRGSQIKSVTDLLPAMQTIFAGILIVLLGLELGETLKAYFAKHEIRVEVILIVAIVAIGRHMIQLDFHHIAASQIFGLSALMLSLTAGYYFVKKAQTQPPGTPESQSRPQDKQ